MPPARRMMLTEELVAKTLRTEVDPGPDADEVLLGDDAFVAEAARGAGLGQQLLDAAMAAIDAAQQASS